MVTKARKGVITSVSVIESEVRCDVEDLFENGIVYDNLRIEKPTSGEIVVPEVGEAVMLRPTYGSKPIITGFIDLPDDTFTDSQAVEDGAVQEEQSIAFALGSDGESVVFERTTDGYNVSIDVAGDVTISAPGDIVIDQGDTPKQVLTEDAVFEYEDTGDTGSGAGPTETKTTTTVSNGEVTTTEID